MTKFGEDKLQTVQLNEQTGIPMITKCTSSFTYSERLLAFIQLLTSTDFHFLTETIVSIETDNLLNPIVAGEETGVFC